MTGKEANGPWHQNTVVEYAKSSARAQDMTSSHFAKVLLLYCGGTIGMKHDSLRGYCPFPGYLASILATTQCFSDPLFMQSIASCDSDSDFDLSSMSEECGPIIMMPPSIYGRRVAFQILEYDPLKDSSNMSMTDWIALASDIERFYHNYDAFVILHGTDTMAYTASALSFLLENLGKTVLLTGSQIPFSEVRNDAQYNLLGALTIAGHYIIPEVCLFFDNKLYRGNRTTKSNAVEFDAFDSPNLKPLAKLGVNIGGFPCLFLFSLTRACRNRVGRDFESNGSPSFPGPQTPRPKCWLSTIFPGNHRSLCASLPSGSDERSCA